MKGLLLFALLLLGGFGGVSTRIAGKLCRAWNYKVDPLVGAFQCPEKLDATIANRCGTCTAPYCCSLRVTYQDPARYAQKTEAGLKLPIEHDSLIVLFYWFALFVWISLYSLLFMCFCMEFWDWLLTRSIQWLMRRKMRQTELEAMEQDEPTVRERPQLRPRQHYRARRGRGKE